MQRLADCIDSVVVTGSENYRSADGKSAPRIEMPLPDHHDLWIEAMRDMIRVVERCSE